MNEGCYLLTGEDNWSKSQYINKVKINILGNNTDMMNLIELYDKEVNIDRIIEAVDTLPFFADKKLIILHETGLFKVGKKDETEKFEKIISSIPEYVIIIIDDKDIDKRNKLYKLVNKNHNIIEFTFPSELQIYEMLLEDLKSTVIDIKKEVVMYFIQNMPRDINYILSEWNKLISYAQNNQITKDIIEEVCVFSLEMRVFELVKKIVNGEITEALSIYYRMLQSKESPIGILVLVSRQYRMIYKVKYLIANGKSQRDISAKLKIPGFVTNEMIDKSKKYSFLQLEEILEECMGTDKNIKNGKMNQNEAVELLIIKCLNKNA